MVHKSHPGEFINWGLLLNLKVLSVEILQREGKFNTKFLAARQFISPTQAPWLYAASEGLQDRKKYNTSNIYTVKKSSKPNFLWPKMARLGPRFHPQNPPEKVYVRPFFASFPENEAHKLFSGGPEWVFWVGAKKLMLKNCMCFFRPLS